MNPYTVLHIPHSSPEIPVDLRDDFILSHKEMKEELLRITDWHTDELFGLPPEEAAMARYPVSRLVVDPERFVDDDREVMASRGMGVVYTRTSSGTRLRDDPSKRERLALIERFYHPHHERLTRLVDLALGEHGRCLVIDCHSFPAVPLPYEMDQNPDRPAICLGTDEKHTPEWLVELAQEQFTQAGYTVETNRPFAGTLVPSKHYQRNTSVLGLMIEVRRDLYMDEEAGGRLPAFSKVSEVVQSTLRRLMEATDLRA